MTARRILYSDDVQWDVPVGLEPRAMQDSHRGDVLARKAARNARTDLRGIRIEYIEFL